MIDLKGNMKNKYKGALVNCDACDIGVPESQNHVMTCSAYEPLRTRKDPILSIGQYGGHSSFLLSGSST